MAQLRGEFSPFFKKSQAEEIVRLIKSGLCGSETGRRLGLSRERVGQVFFNSTGQSIREYWQKVALEKAQELKRIKTFHRHSGKIKRVLPEEKRMFESFLSHDLPTREIADCLGIKRAHISTYMRLIAYRLLYWHYQKGGKI